jgi:large subunit ribosomal protein L33
MARKTGDIRGVITLQCADCRERNYTTEKNRRNDTQRLELRKYCPRCRAHKTHREVR